MVTQAPEYWADQFPDTGVRAPDALWLQSIVALGEVIFSTADGPPPPERLHWVCQEVEDFFDRASPQSRLVFHLSLTAIRVVAPLLVLRPVPLSWLSLEDRAAALERFERSPLGAALFAVKAILCIIYYEHPDAAREIGFDGAPLVAW